MHHVDRFYYFLYFHSAQVDTPEYRPRIVDFYVWWTQPMPSYCHFVALVQEVVILSKSHSLPVDDEMSSTIFDSSSNDSEATLHVSISPQSVFPKPCVPPSRPCCMSLTGAGS